MARSSREQSELTAASVRQAASLLFAERGFAAVGLDEVAAAAGVTRGAVYHHYGSKEGLFRAVAVHAQNAVAEEVVAAAENTSETLTSIESLLAGCRAFLAASIHPARRRTLLIDAPVVLGWAEWREQDAAASGRHLIEAVEALQKSGEIKVLSARGTAVLLSGALNEAALYIAEDPDQDAALAAVWPDFERLITGLRAPGAARELR